MEEKEIILKIQELFKKGNDLEMNEKIDLQEIENSLKRSKNGAPGPDELTNMMLKNSIEIIKEPLCDIMNKIKESKEDFPTSWELGDLIFFFKGTGDPFTV